MRTLGCFYFTESSKVRRWEYGSAGLVLCLVSGKPQVHPQHCADWVWWGMPVIETSRRWRQEDRSQYVANLRPIRTGYMRPRSINKKN